MGGGIGQRCIALKTVPLLLTVIPRLAKHHSKSSAWPHRRPCGVQGMKPSIDARRRPAKSKADLQMARQQTPSTESATLLRHSTTSTAEVSDTSFRFICSRMHRSDPPPFHAASGIVTPFRSGYSNAKCVEDDGVPGFVNTSYAVSLESTRRWHRRRGGRVERTANGGGKGRMERPDDGQIARRRIDARAVDLRRFAQRVCFSIRTSSVGGADASFVGRTSSAQCASRRSM